MKYKDIREQLRETRQSNEMLTAELNRNKANVDYIAMMADVELFEDEAEGGLTDGSDGD